jgi:UDPglucose--hexose-1-phosphate uridylyltransferase
MWPPPNETAMRELRKDRISGQWVVIAPSRRDRPQEFAGHFAHGLPADDIGLCPICPGNEHELPGILVEHPAKGPAGWSVRVVPNKFGAFIADAERPDDRPGFDAARPIGFSEVIIESPRHDADLTTLSDEELLTLMHTYRERFSALIGREGIRRVIIFRNSGPLSGASLVHPHSQLVATHIDPPQIIALEARALEYYGQHSKCILCDEIEKERKAAQRIVETNDDFAVVVPFAAQYPSEIWIVPLRHQARFDEIADSELETFGLMLRRALRQLHAVHGALSYNFVVDSAGTTDARAQHLHWRLRIAPKLTYWGGFELGTNLPINPSSPEDDAAALRGAGPV